MEKSTKMFIVTDQGLYDDLLQTWKGYLTSRVELRLGETFDGGSREIRIASVIERKTGKTTVTGFISWPDLSIADKTEVEKIRDAFRASFENGITDEEVMIIGSRSTIKTLLGRTRRMASRYHWIGETFGWGVSLDLENENAGRMRQLVSELATMMVLDLDEQISSEALARAKATSRDK